MSQQCSETIKNYASAAQSLATIVALIVGGLWTYDLFVEQRKGVSQANISHSLTTKKVSDEQTWVHVAVTVSNSGETILTLKSGEVRVQQILPLVSKIAESLRKGVDPTAPDKRVVPWPTLCYRDTPLNIKIEPNEEDAIFYEFFVQGHIQTIKVYSYFESETPDGNGQRLGWTNTTIHDITMKEGDKNESASTLQPRSSFRICTN